MSIRIGQGIDRHRLVPGRRLVLGGVEIPHDRGLDGHSDADALVHAICDALLGAAALGDIGQHFADTDPAHANRNSLEFLTHVVQLLSGQRLRPGNVDATVMAETPKLAPHIAAMRAKLAAALGLSLDRVSVKATRGEGMGPEGRGEAITAHAVALVVEDGEATR